MVRFNRHAVWLSRLCDTNDLALAAVAQTMVAGSTRFVVIRASDSGTDAYLQVSQIVVSAGGVNIARGKPCTSSSQFDANSPCSLAVDGNAATRSHPGIFVGQYVNNDWIRIDLLADFPVTSVTYYNRGVCHNHVAYIHILMNFTSFRNAVNPV